MCFQIFNISYLKTKLTYIICLFSVIALSVWSLESSMHTLWKFEVRKFLHKDILHLICHILVLLRTLSDWLSSEHPMLLGFSQKNAAENDHIGLVVSINHIERNPRSVFEKLKLKMTIFSASFLPEIDMGPTSRSKRVGIIWPSCIKLARVELLKFARFKSCDVGGNTFIAIFMTF